MANENNTAKTPWWLALIDMGVSVYSSYRTAKQTTNAGWVKDGYRDQLITSAAATVVNIAMQQVAQMQQPATATVPEVSAQAPTEPATQQSVQ